MLKQQEICLCGADKNDGMRMDIICPKHDGNFYIERPKEDKKSEKLQQEKKI